MIYIQIYCISALMCLVVYFYTYSTQKEQYEDDENTATGIALAVSLFPIVNTIVCIIGLIMVGIKIGEVIHDAVSSVIYRIATVVSHFFSKLYFDSRLSILFVGAIILVALIHTFVIEGL